MNLNLSFHGHKVQPKKPKGGIKISSSYHSPFSKKPKKAFEHWTLKHHINQHHPSTMTLKCAAVAVAATFDSLSSFTRPSPPIKLGSTRARHVIKAQKKKHQQWRSRDLPYHFKQWYSSVVSPCKGHRTGAQPRGVYELVLVRSG